MPGIGTQVLTKTFAIVLDQGIRGIEDVAMRAIILFKLNQIFDLKFTFEGRHIAHVRAAEGIDTLVVITHREYCSLGSCHQFQPLVLQVISVLKFVDKNVLKTRLIVFTQGLIAAQ